MIGSIATGGGIRVVGGYYMRVQAWKNAWNNWEGRIVICPARQARRNLREMVANWAERWSSQCRSSGVCERFNRQSCGVLRDCNTVTNNQGLGGETACHERT